MLRSDFCDYNDAYIFAKGRITVTVINNGNKRNKKLTFNNNAPFRSRISEINNIFVDNILYNLLEYSDYYSMTSGSLWKYYIDKINGYENKSDNTNKG